MTLNFIQELIDRKQMPQVASAHLSDMLGYLAKNGISSKAERVDAKKLKPMQTLNMDKVKAMTSNPRSLDKPNLVANDYSIVDGHHRWGAAKELGMEVNVIRLNAPFQKIRDVLAHYKHTEYKSISEDSMDKPKTILVENLSPEMNNVVRVLGSAQRVKVMTGGQMMYSDKDNQITIAGIKNGLGTHVTITYSGGNDAYDVKLYKVRGLNFKEVSERKGVHVGELLRTLEGITGLAWRL